MFQSCVRLLINGGTLRQQQRCPEVADLAKSQAEQLDSVEASKNPRVTSRELQSSLARQGCKEKAALKYQALWGKVEVCKNHLDKTFNHWKKVLWTAETKIELFGHNERHYVWRKPKTAFKEKNLLPTVKHSEGSIMVWGCFAASGTGKRAHIEGTMNPNDYQLIFRENVPPSVRYLKLGRGWILQQDNDFKHTSKST